MPFEIGDHVHVRSLGKGIVREVRKGGRCRVEIKGRSLLVDERQLSPVDDRKRRSTALSMDEQTASSLPSRSHAAASIDLHGMTTDEAVTAIDTFVSDAILAGLPGVRVIHGRSGGRVKGVVHSRLRSMTAVRAFRIDPTNPGVTIVVF